MLKKFIKYQDVGVICSYCNVESVTMEFVAMTFEKFMEKYCDLEVTFLDAVEVPDECSYSKNGNAFDVIFAVSCRDLETVVLLSSVIPEFNVISYLDVPFGAEKWGKTIEEKCDQYFNHYVSKPDHLSLS
jgi:hypothetical protein